MDLIFKRRVVSFFLDSLFCVIFYKLFFSDSGNDMDLLYSKSNLLILPVIQLIYFFSLEFFFNQTIGKKIMKLRVVFLNDESQKILKVFKRTVIRVFPFEPFSFFLETKNITWHERYSATRTVLVKKKASYPRSPFPHEE